MTGPSYDAFLADAVEEYMRDDEDDNGVDDDAEYEDDAPCGDFWSP